MKFQIDAQEELINKGLTLLSRTKGSTAVLKSPTGSGKTVMMAKVLAGMQQKSAHKLVFIWIAPNKLHEQSHKRLKSLYAASQELACVKPDDIGDEIPDKTVLFLNWDSVNSDNLVLRRDNETRRNLDSMLGKARLAGKKIVLVVDESHLHLNSGKEAKVVVDEIIRPDLLIEVSATPNTQNPDIQVEVLREDVIEAGMIRKRIVVNPGGDVEYSGDQLRTTAGTATELMDNALAYRNRLEVLFRAEGSPVNPLILVQLPDRGGDFDALADLENHLLMKHEMDRSNGQVAVWLSEDKENHEDIAQFGSPAKILFFKQAIATGWDCPRAQILVNLREMKSPTFTTQVLGRVLRQPERKHYANDELNHGYAFTNYESLKLDADTAAWLGKAMLTRTTEFKLPLPNLVRKHVDKRGYLTHEVLAHIAKHRDLVKGCGNKGSVLAHRLENVHIEDIDEQLEIQGNKDVALGLKGLQEQLNRLKRELARSLSSQDGGQKYIEKALRDAAEEVCDTYDEQTVLEAVLHSRNWDSYARMVEKGIAAFLEQQARKADEFEVRPDWEAPEHRYVELSRSLSGYTKHVYKPVLNGNFEKSNVEEPFSRVLEADSNVTSWLKNGDHGREHFAPVSYELNGETRLFYPDFLVMYADGHIGLYDTKGSGTSDQSTGNTEDTKAKAEALYAYIQTLCAEGKLVRGGIVVLKHNEWWVHDGESYRGTVEVSEKTGWVRAVFAA